MPEPPLVPRLPEPEQHHSRQHTGDGRDDIDQLKPDEIGPEELDPGERPPDDQQGGPDRECRAQSGHRADQPEGNQEREEGQDPPGGGALEGLRRGGSVTLVQEFRIGVPIAPQATGAVLAMRQSKAAWNGWNPSPTRNAAEIATGAPNPAAPSIKAPKEKATSTA